MINGERGRGCVKVCMGGAEIFLSEGNEIMNGSSRAKVDHRGPFCRSSGRFPVTDFFSHCHLPNFPTAS